MLDAFRGTALPFHRLLGRVAVRFGKQRRPGARLRDLLGGERGGSGTYPRFTGVLLRAMGQAQSAVGSAEKASSATRIRGPALQRVLDLERLRIAEEKEQAGSIADAAAESTKVDTGATENCHSHTGACQHGDLATAATTRTRLPGSTKVNGRFVIDTELFPDWVDHISDVSGVFKWKWGMRGKTAPMPSARELDELLPVRAPDAAALAAPPESAAQVTWLGHASCLVQWEGWTVLADPIFSERCSPMQWAGPKRVRPSPIQVDALPRVDAIVISHNHYDHLDLGTVRDLLVQQPEATFFVPLGMKAWFEEARRGGSKNVVEMDWGEEVVLRDEDIDRGGRAGSTEENREVVDAPGEKAGAASSSSAHPSYDEARKPLTVVCVPCQHWCKRTPIDTNQCLWASWIAKTDNLTYFFGGDTGYCGEVFKMTGDLYPVDLSAIPIAAYGVPEERWFHKPNHMNPEEAVQCHLDLHSKQSVGVHWGTFPLTGEHIMEPPQRLKKAAKKAGLGEEEFVTLEHGETRVFDVVREETVEI